MNEDELNELEAFLGLHGMSMLPWQRDVILAAMKPTAYIPGYCPASLLCRDLDSDCEGIRDKHACQAHDTGKGVCPYVIGHPEFT